MNALPVCTYTIFSCLVLMEVRAFVITVKNGVKHHVGALQKPQVFFLALYSRILKGNWESLYLVSGLTLGVLAR